MPIKDDIFEAGKQRLFLLLENNSSLGLFVFSTKLYTCRPTYDQPTDITRHSCMTERFIIGN